MICSVIFLSEASALTLNTNNFKEQVILLNENLPLQLYQKCANRANVQRIK